MSSNSSSTASGGIGVFGILGVAFVVLKLCGVIGWSWWLVTLPFYAPAILVLAAMLFIVVVSALAR